MTSLSSTSWKRGRNLLFPDSEEMSTVVFHRDRVTGFDPSFPGATMSLPTLREHVLMSAINGTAAGVRSPPYRELVARSLRGQLAAVVKSVAGSPQPTKKGTRHSRVVSSSSK